MKVKKEKAKAKGEKALLTFLQRTKDGKYARIDESSLVYTRIEPQREETYTNEEYYYSVR